MFLFSRFCLPGALAFTLAAVLALSQAKLATAQYPGTPVPASSEAGDLKSGSILFYNLYNSKADNTAEDTVLALTNTNTTTGVLVRLFFVNAAGSPINYFVQLGARQTATLLASEVDPDQRGYVLAVAVDSASHCPIQFNYLMGEAAIKFASGHKGNLSAIGIAALTATPGVCSGNTAVVNFDGVSYNQLPRVISLDNISSIADGNSTMIAINRVGGDLTSGASTTGTLFSLLYDDAETVFSSTLPGATQVFGMLSDSFPRTAPRFSQIIPAGRSGWLRLWNNNQDVALLGAVLNFNPTTSAIATSFNTGHNWTHRTLTATGSYTLPLTAPDLVVSKTHTGAFTFGGTGVYTLTVTNNGTAMGTLMPITVTDTLPANLTLASFSGAGWNCTGVGTANVACVTNATLAAGASTTSLTLTVNVNGGTPIGTNSITNTATVSNLEDGNPANNSANDPTTIACQSITVSPANPTLPNGTAGTAYSQNFTQSGAFGAVTFSLSAGALPQGLSLSAAGLLSGTPAQTGVFNFTVKATDMNGCMGTQAYALTINCSTVTLSPNTLPASTAGAVYNQTITASGGVVPYSFNVSAGALPAGLTLLAAGALSGTPTVTGSFNFTVKATDANGCMGTQAYTLVLNCPTITVSPATLPNGTNGGAYNQTVTATGGVGATTWSLSAGTLPGGVNLNAATGALTGTLNAAGTFNFTLRATDSNGCFGERAYGVTVSNCPTIIVNPANPTLPNGRAGTAYSQSFTQTGGAGTVIFSLSAGALPNGLTLAAGGLLSGTPTVNGTFNFTVRATDANNCVGEGAYTLFLNPPCTAITLNPATLANGFLSTAYSQTLTASGGTAPYSFAVTTGSAPSGLTLTSGGGLTGTPTAIGSFNFTVTATDNTGCTGTRAYTVLVSGNGLQFFALPAPVRLLDTRTGASACSQPNTPIAGGTALTQPGRSLCTIPANAVALTGNITTVQSGGGFLTLYPSNATQPTVASTNYAANEIVNNVFTVGLGVDGAFKLFAATTTDVVVDVTGYYAPPSTGGLYFHPLPAPVRLLETRAGQQGCITPGAPLTGNADSTQQAISACTGIPAAARAIVGNATTVGPQGGGFLTLFPGDAARPLVASSNYNFNQIVNGPFSVGLSATGQFKIYTSATTDLVVDVLGYYSTEAGDVNGAGLLFTPLAHPVRLLETRAGEPVGCFKPGAPLNGTQEYTQPARGLCDGVTLPANALGVVGNATVILPNGGGFLTLWPGTAATRPLVATANYNPGDVVNRHFIVGLGQANGDFKIFSAATTELVIDLSGYFAP